MEGSLKAENWERRQKTRAEFETKVNLSSERKEYRECSTRDLSLSGIFVQGVSGLCEGEQCQIEISSSKVVLKIEGEVARISQDGVALRFLNMDHDCYHHLQTIILYNTPDPSEIAWEFDAEFESNQ